MPTICLRSFAMRVWMRRRSSSIFVSPGPREPMPAPPPPTWPPAWRDIDSPQPRRRGSRYSSCASSTCALPSRLLACWLKMSRMTAVRSMTLTFTTSSSARRWLGASSVSAITVSAPSAATTSRSSSALPLPRYVLGSGCGRRCRTPSSTTAPAVSARAASSRIEFSASSCAPCGYTPMSTTFSRRSCRYSTSVTSSSSVESPRTRRSAARSSRSHCSPSVVPPSAASDQSCWIAEASPAPNRATPAFDSALRNTRSTASSAVVCSASFILSTLLLFACDSLLA